MKRCTGSPGFPGLAKAFLSAHQACAGSSTLTKHALIFPDILLSTSPATLLLAYFHDPVNVQICTSLGYGRSRGGAAFETILASINRRGGGVKMVEEQEDPKFVLSLEYN